MHKEKIIDLQKELGLTDKEIQELSKGLTNASHAYKCSRLTPAQNRLDLLDFFLVHSGKSFSNT